MSSKRPVTLDKLFGYILVYKNNEKRSLMKKFREGTLTARILSKKKFLLFLIKLLRNPNISQKCKIGVFKKASSARSTLWLYFKRKKYFKKAQGKKFRVCIPTNRFFSKKIKFYFFKLYSFGS